MISISDQIHNFLKNFRIKIFLRFVQNFLVRLIKKSLHLCGLNVSICIKSSHCQCIAVQSKGMSLHSCPWVNVQKMNLLEICIKDMLNTLNAAWALRVIDFVLYFVDFLKVHNGTSAQICDFDESCKTPSKRFCNFKLS